MANFTKPRLDNSKSPSRGLGLRPWIAPKSERESASLHASVAIGVDYGRGPFPFHCLLTIELPMTELPNPYAAQGDHSHLPPVVTNNGLAARGDFMIVQVIVLAILQIVVGILEMIMAVFLVLYSFLMPMVMAEAAKNNPQANMPEQFGTYMTIYLAVTGGAMVLFSILRIASGIRLFYFKGRMLTILSLLGGLTGIASCYCSVTSIGLAIYGLIVVFHPAVVYAFQLGSSGWTASQIRDHFAAARLGLTPSNPAPFQP